MKNDDYEGSDYKVKIYGIIISVIFTFILLTLIFQTFYTVNAGERGVLLTFGKADLNAKEEGLHFKTPIAQSVVKFDTRTQKYEADASAASKDLQIVSAKIAVNYHLIPESVPRLFVEIGGDYRERIIQPAVQEVVKASTAQFTAEELITKRPLVKDRIKELLIERLHVRNIIVEDISIVNFDFSKEFNTAIEAKVTAEQLKLKAQNDLERIKIEKEQTIVQAQAQAEALKVQKEQVTPELLQLRMIEKWNGVMPLYIGGNINPFLSITTQGGK